MESRPDPPVPRDTDLRDFAFMPLDVARLRDSDLVAETSAEGFRAAMLLWCASWHQVPAASLPDRPGALAMLAGFGRDLDGWHAVADEALHGFVPCSDGRLYHPVIAEKALDAWARKRDAQHRRQQDRERKARARSGGLPQDVRRKSGGLPQDVRARTGTMDNGQGQGREEPDRARGTGAPSLPQDGLMGLIAQAFVERGKHLVLSEHQLGYVRLLADRASPEENPKDWTRRYLETAWSLRERGQGVWKGQPWQPSAICGERMQARVIEAMDGRSDVSEHDFDRMRKALGGAE